jgi:hypothetical protein
MPIINGFYPVETRLRQGIAPLRCLANFSRLAAVNLSCLSAYGLWQSEFTVAADKQKLNFT